MRKKNKRTNIGKENADDELQFGLKRKIDLWAKTKNIGMN